MKNTTILIGLWAAIVSTNVLADSITIDQGKAPWRIAASACDDVYESCNASCQSLKEQCASSRNENNVKACQTKVHRCRHKCDTYLKRCSSYSN